MDSIAHKKSKSSIIDPAYSTDVPVPEIPPPATPFFWLYGIREYSCYRLAEMRAAVKKAKLLVGYPGEFKEPFKAITFHSAFPGGNASFRVCGTVDVSLNGHEVAVEQGADGVYRFHSGPGELRISVCSDTVPALQSHWNGEWSCSTPHHPERFGVEQRPDTEDGIPPHLKELPILDIIPAKRNDGLYDAGRELLAYIEIHTKNAIRLYVGESVQEAENDDPAHFEQTTELIEVSPGLKRSIVPLAFRYFRLAGDSGDSRIVCKALFTPEVYRGAFACPDRMLNDIWMRSAYTLRLCTRHFLMDGIKRDRLPWSGDLRISLLASAFTFADRQTLRNTLEVLGSAGIRKTHINGITDYSLWYIINQDSYQLYFDDPEFLNREYANIADMMDVIRSQEDEHGFLASGPWLFIDWVDFEKRSALQMLYFWALKSAAALALRMNDGKRHETWLARAEELGKHIRQTFRNPAGLYQDSEDNTAIHRHANSLAILAGIEGKNKQIAQALAGTELPSTGTPYMAAMEILALAACGHRDKALHKLRYLWGAMLNNGATTFYEAYEPDAPLETRYSFYDRKFALSLCHAWGAGPASILPELFFGIRPLKDGWREFETDPWPAFGENEEMFLTVPTPHGDIVLEYSHGRLSVQAPPACRMKSPAQK